MVVSGSVKVKFNGEVASSDSLDIPVYVQGLLDSYNVV